MCVFQVWRFNTGKTWSSDRLDGLKAMDAVMIVIEVMWEARLRDKHFEVIVS